MCKSIDYVTAGLSTFQHKQGAEGGVGTIPPGKLERCYHCCGMEGAEGWCGGVESSPGKSPPEGWGWGVYACVMCSWRPHKENGARGRGGRFASFLETSFKKTSDQQGGRLTFLLNVVYKRTNKGGQGE